MRAAVVPELNAPWEVRDVPTPDPGPGQVLIRIAASGLCYTDVHITKGSGPSTEFPRTLGHEPVGEIVAVGEGVRGRRSGDRVGVPWVQDWCGRCEWCLRDKPLFCPDQVGTGVQSQGSHAEYMLAAARGTMLLPERLSYEQAAPIFCAGFTVWSGLRLADPKPAERVAVQGVGGLGHLAIQYAKAAGFHTIAVTHSPDKHDLVRELGADDVVASGAELAAAGGADVLLATSNSYSATADAMEGMRPDGRVMVMGVSEEPLALPPWAIEHRLRIIASKQGSREWLYEALAMAARGQVRVVAETFALEDIGRAYERVAAGDVRFRAVITTGA